MTLQICVYEDHQYGQFYPITSTRPVATMRAGILPLFRRAERFFDDYPLCLAVRDDVAGLVAVEHRDYPVNIIKRNPDQAVLFLNGRIREFADLPDLVRGTRLSTVFRNQGEVVAVLFDAEAVDEIGPVASPQDYVTLFHDQRADLAEFDTLATLYNYSWEIMGDIEKEVTADFRFLKSKVTGSKGGRVHQGSYILSPDQVYLGMATEVMPLSLLDASNGPICIGDNTRVEPQAALYGPCYIGPNSVVVAGKIVSSSIGHTCRVGGEVEESVFHSYINKYHAGFIGHSYIGSWVNFGAMTTNSDLKNNYTEIQVSVRGKPTATGLIKVGSFIGDHTKFGIGTLLNTGINVGVCCNIYGGGLVTDKEIGSFRWGDGPPWTEYRIDKALETVRRSMERRNIVLTGQEEALLRAIAEGRESDRGVIGF